MRTISLKVWLAAVLVAASAWAEDAIRVDAEFPGGNIVVQRIDGDTVSVAPDQRDIRRGQWWFYWCFRLRAPGRTASDGGVHGEEPDRGARAGGQHRRRRDVALARRAGGAGRPAGRPTGMVVCRRGAGRCSEVRYAFCPSYVGSHLQAWLARHRDHPAVAWTSCAAAARTARSNGCTPAASMRRGRRGSCC